MKQEPQAKEGKAAIPAGGYDPREFRALTFHDAIHGFRDGADSPRAYLERCLELIEAREPVVRSFVPLAEAGARAAADSLSPRVRARRPPASLQPPRYRMPPLLPTDARPARQAQTWGAT